MEKVIQFMHPGAEHSKVSGRKWNTSIHKRKFIINQGSILVGDEQVSGELEFWGEFESPAKLFREFKTNSKPYPRYLWKPLPIDSNYQLNIGAANTDPYIFGCFAYTICKKFRKINNKEVQKATILHNGLQTGDLILFGSQVNGYFVLDTLFVVGRAVEINEENYKKLKKDYGDTFIKAALEPIFTEKYDSSDCSTIPTCSKLSRKNITIHFGATYDNPVKGMYSFVPARLWKKESLGFPRPIISLSPISHNAQNFCYCIKSSNISEVKDFWMNVKKEVTKAGLFPATQINMIK